MPTVRITWIDSITPGVIGHKVYRDDVELTDLGIGVQTYDDLTAIAGATYKYEVQAYTTTGESIDETLGVNTDNITISVLSINPPTLLTDAGSEANPDTEINLTWTKSTTGVMTEYRVYVGGVLQQTFVGDVALGTLTGLTASTLYSNITVRAYDGAIESSDSNAISITTEAGVVNIYETGTGASPGSEADSLGAWVATGTSPTFALMRTVTSLDTPMQGGNSFALEAYNNGAGTAVYSHWIFSGIAGKTYTLNVMVKANGNGDPRIALRGDGITDQWIYTLTTDWVAYELVATAASDGEIRFVTYVTYSTSGEQPYSVIVDDVYIVES